MLNPLKKTKNAWSLIFLMVKFYQLMSFLYLKLFSLYNLLKAF